MSLSLIENEKSRRFFSISGRSVSEGGALLPRVGFTPELARAVIETQGSMSKATPKGTLLSEIEQKYQVPSTFECSKLASTASVASKNYL